MADVLTPSEVEARLVHLAKELDEATDDLTSAEVAYHTSKINHELAMARSRLRLAREATESRLKLTVQDKADMALDENAQTALQEAADEAWVRGSRANLVRIRTQIEIARSLGASVRASYELT